MYIQLIHLCVSGTRGGGVRCSTRYQPPSLSLPPPCASRDSPTIAIAAVTPQAADYVRVTLNLYVRVSWNLYESTGRGPPSLISQTSLDQGESHAHTGNCGYWGTVTVGHREAGIPPLYRFWWGLGVWSGSWKAERTWAPNEECARSISLTGVRPDRHLEAFRI